MFVELCISYFLNMVNTLICHMFHNLEVLEFNVGLEKQGDLIS